MKVRDSAGFSGRIAIHRHANAVGLDFEDLFERIDGEWRPRAEYIDSLETTEARNKVLLRGLSYILHALLAGHPGGPYVPSQITANQTTNPFQAFFLLADDAGATTYPADAKPDWGESNGTYDSKISPNPGVAGQGVRCVLLSDTTGPGLKQVSIAYPTTNPYREIEYTMFAQANTPAYASGSVTFVAGSSHSDGEWFQLSDGINPAVTFELDLNSSVSEWDGDPTNNVPVRFTGSETADEMKDLAIAAVNGVISWMSLNRYPDEVGSGLLITASSGGTGVMSLAHDVGGEIGNTTIEVSTSPAFSGSKVNFSGGSDSSLETNDDGIDNLPIKGLGLAAGVQCGDGEANSTIGTRSVIGLASTAQGISDREYFHEGTGLHSYSGSETIGTYGNGYHSSSEQEDNLRSISSDSGDSVTAATKVIRMMNGNFTGSDLGLGIKFTSGTNTGTKTIVNVISVYDVQVAEAVVDESSGFTCDVIHPGTGDKSFDGDIYCEGNRGYVDLGDKWRSTTSSGPHAIARVWATSKAIHGVRVVSAANVNKANCPDLFKVQKLATQSQGNGSGPVLEDDLEPANDAHWIDVGAEVDFTSTSQDDNIFDAAEVGYEYLFTSPTTTRGIRLASMTASTSTSDVQIGEFLIFGEVAAISFTAGVDDALRIATNGVPTGPGVPGSPGSYTTFEFGDLTTSGDISQEDVQDVADWLNKELRGYNLEAVRSDLGILWIRSTTEGNEDQVDFDSLANGSTALLKLGLGTAAFQKVGRTEVELKFPGDAETFIYRFNISGDLPAA